MKIVCNECYKVLTKKELSKYPTLWRFSGDMYCKKHEKGKEFKRGVK